MADGDLIIDPTQITNENIPQVLGAIVIELRRINMKIENIPFYELKKYFGKISLPELQDKVFMLPNFEIPFTIYKRVDRSRHEDYEDVDYKITFDMKMLNGKKIGGKVRTYIVDKIVEEINTKHIQL